MLKSYGQGNKSYGDVFNFHGTERLIYKFSGTTINLRGIFPHMDRHTPVCFNEAGVLRSSNGNARIVESLDIHGQESLVARLTYSSRNVSRHSKIACQ